MMMDNRQFLSIGQVQGQYLNGQLPKEDNNKQNIPAGENSFASVLNKVKDSADNRYSTEELKFSKHAVNRLNDRNIELTREQMQRLNQGKIEAGEKGIKESLILVDELAFIVNAPRVHCHRRLILQ